MLSSGTVIIGRGDGRNLALLAVVPSLLGE